MNYQTEVRGMRFFHGDDGKAPFAKLAMAEIYIPELDANISDVVLTWSKGKGWVAQAPYSRRGATPLIQWNYHGDFAIDLAGKLKTMFLAMGGKNPEKPKRQFIPLRDLDLSEDEGLPMRERIEDALEDESRKRGVQCYTEFFERTEPELEAEDHEATEGLHRILGVDPAVTEACDRAGL